MSLDKRNIDKFPNHKCDGVGKTTSVGIFKDGLLFEQFKLLNSSVPFK